MLVLRPPWEKRRSLQEVLRDPLPDAEMYDLFPSNHGGGAHDTHPTTVEDWPDANQEIRQYIENHIMVSLIHNWYLLATLGACQGALLLQSLLAPKSKVAHKTVYLPHSLDAFRIGTRGTTRPWAKIN